MDIGSYRTLVALETADNDVLAYGLDLLLKKLRNGHLCADSLLCEELLNVCGLLCHYRLSDCLYKALEISVLCNEVGLSVYLKGNACSAVVVCHSECNALGSYS